jgi:hypothetical protein
MSAESPKKLSFFPKALLTILRIRPSQGLILTAYPALKTARPAPILTPLATDDGGEIWAVSFLILANLASLPEACVLAPQEGSGYISSRTLGVADFSRVHG